MASKESKNLANQQAAALAAQIANMAAQLEFQKERMRLLELPQYQHLKQMDIDKLAFEKSQATWENALKEATMTGTYQGQPTLQWLEQQAKLYGVIDGKQTLEGKLSDAQIAQIKHSMDLQSHAALLEDQKFGFERERWGQEFDYQIQKDLRDYGLSEAAITGMYNGQPTMAAKELESKNTQAYLGLLGSLQGAGNAFKQMRVLSAAGNLNDLAAQWTGKYQAAGMTGMGQAPGQAQVSDLFNGSYANNFINGTGIPGQPLPPGSVGSTGLAYAPPPTPPIRPPDPAGVGGVHNFRLEAGTPPPPGAAPAPVGPVPPPPTPPADTSREVGITDPGYAAPDPSLRGVAASIANMTANAGIRSAYADTTTGNDATLPGQPLDYRAPDTSLQAQGPEWTGNYQAPTYSQADWDAASPQQAANMRAGYDQAAWAAMSPAQQQQYFAGGGAPTELQAQYDAQQQSAAVAQQLAGTPAVGTQAPPAGEQGYAVSPAGTQAPIGAYNYEATPSGQTQVYPPGVAAPMDSAQTSTVTPQNMSGNIGLLPSQINAENYENSNEYAKQFLWGYLENEGWDPVAAQSAYQKSLPRYGGPASGTVNAGLGF